MDQKLFKIAQNGPKRPKIAQNGPKLFPSLSRHQFSTFVKSNFIILPQDLTLLNLFNETARSISEFGISNWTINLKSKGFFVGMIWNHCQLCTLCSVYPVTSSIFVCWTNRYQKPKSVELGNQLCLQAQASLLATDFTKRWDFFIPNWTELVKCPPQW